MRCKRVLAAVICLLLCLHAGLFAQAGDADVQLRVSSPQIFAGDTLTVTLSLGRTLQNVVSFDFLLRFDADVFTLQTASIGESRSELRVSQLKTDADGAYYAVSFVDRTSAGCEMRAGTLCTMTFVSAADLPGDRTAAFSLVSEGVYDPAFTPIPVTAGTASSVSVLRVQPVRLTVDTPPDKTVYRYRETLDTTGLAVSCLYNNGKTETVTTQCVCTPDAFVVSSGLPLFGLSGDVPVTVSYASLQTTFTVRVRLTVGQWLIKLLLFGWLWY